LPASVKFEQVKAEYNDQRRHLNDQGRKEIRKGR